MLRVESFCTGTRVLHAYIVRETGTRICLAHQLLTYGETHLCGPSKSHQSSARTHNSAPPVCVCVDIGWREINHPQIHSAHVRPLITLTPTNKTTAEQQNNRTTEQQTEMQFIIYICVCWRALISLFSFKSRQRTRTDGSTHTKKKKKHKHTLTHAVRCIISRRSSFHLCNCRAISQCAKFWAI